LHVWPKPVIIPCHAQYTRSFPGGQA